MRRLGGGRRGGGGWRGGGSGEDACPCRLAVEPQHRATRTNVARMASRAQQRRSGCTVRPRRPKRRRTDASHPRTASPVRRVVLTAARSGARGGRSVYAAQQQLLCRLLKAPRRSQPGSVADRYLPHILRALAKAHGSREVAYAATVVAASASTVSCNRRDRP